MSRKRYSSVDIEALLATEEEAEALGVSARSVVDVDELTGPLARLTRDRDQAATDRWRIAPFMRAAVPLAACLAIVVGLGRQGGPLTAPSADHASVVQASADCVGAETIPWISLASFAGCLSGPGQPISAAEWRAASSAENTASGWTWPPDARAGAAPLVWIHNPAGLRP